MVWVTGVIKTGSGDDCVVITLSDLDGLDPASERYTFEPFCSRSGAVANGTPDAFEALDWGGFTAAMR